MFLWYVSSFSKNIKQNIIHTRTHTHTHTHTFTLTTTNNDVLIGSAKLLKLVYFHC